MLAVVRQGLTLLELGHAVIELRALLQMTADGPVARSCEATLQALAAYLAAPRDDTRTAAIYVLRAAGPAVRAGLATASGADAVRLRLALTDLHAIYTSLLDQVPQPSLNGTPDAA
jgi:hypothetical protein